MKTLLYDKETLDLFKTLLHVAPMRIFSDEFYHVAFDYGNQYILATPDDLVAATQNNSDEAITVKFVKHKAEYVEDADESLIFEHQSITRLWVMRTLLYFTDHKTFENEEEALTSMNMKDNPDQILKDIMSKTTGGHEKIVCHPKSQEAKQVDKVHANLVDAGIMLEIDGQYYICCSLFNSFSTYAQIKTLEQIQEDIASLYDFIELGS